MLSKIDLRNLVQQLPSQNNIECCSSCAVLLAAEMLMSAVGKKCYFSRLYLYYVSRKLYNPTIRVRGSTLKCTFDALSRHGVPFENFWPFKQNLVDIEPNKQAIESAVYNKLQSYKHIPTNKIKEYLSNNNPVIIGMNTGRAIEIFWEGIGSAGDVYVHATRGRSTTWVSSRILELGIQ